MNTLKKAALQIPKFNCPSVGGTLVKRGHADASFQTSSSNKVVGGHITILKDEVVSLLKPQAGKTFIDMTFGAGGHTAAILEESPDAKIIALDRDSVAKKYAADIRDRYPNSDIKLFEGSFTDLLDLLSNDQSTPSNIADGILFDIGASSMQFNDRRRGFALKSKGPLDMRMSKSSNVTAADVVNKLEEKELYKILKIYGEEKKARQIARAVVNHRQMIGPITTTRELQDIVYQVYEEEDFPDPRDSLGRKRHSATLTFQALRIFVNDELNQLYNGLKMAHVLLKPNGVCAVISFHSLEHNIVYQVFNPMKAITQQTLVTEDLMNSHLFPWRCNRSVVKPVAEEISTNPQARSAELRHAYKKSVLY